QIFPNPDPNANTIQIVSTNNTTNLTGGAGNDQFIFSNGASLTNGIITGGGGPHNLLDYEAEGAGAGVDVGSQPFTSANVTARLVVPAAVPPFVLLPNTAPGTGGVFGVQDVIGSNAGGNILAGDSGNNRLEGRGNRNIIFGGGGHDVIIGDSSDKLFSGGAAASNASIIFEGHSPPNALDPTQMVSDPASTDLLVINSCAEFFARQIILAPSLGSTIVALNGNFANPNDPVALTQLLQDTQIDPPAAPAPGNGGSLTPQQFAANRHQVAVSFVASMEHNATVINGYYQQFLGRSADTAGLQGWLHFLALGGRSKDVLTGILRSDEYFARNGSTNDTFVKALYHDLLGRTASAPEVAGWVQALGTLSRAAVIGGFVNSDEYRSDLLGGWYQAYLGRGLDAGGQAGWLAQMRAGMSWEEVQANILTSGEFQARVSNLASDANQSFIIGLYLHVLGRSASSAEVAGWLGVLNTP
ncbi:MAG TPA: DUF4214 domain-containing protein, partial [Gemmataceae bacterium]|nr:DUF4214 domain-containing protein [Gemmataceae bacterium]